jgi:hypothetical protein
VPRSHIDDEYAHAGEVDPKVLITTSRDPSSRLVQFAKVGGDGGGGCGVGCCGVVRCGAVWCGGVRCGVVRWGAVSCWRPVWRASKGQC